MADQAILSRLSEPRLPVLYLVLISQCILDSDNSSCTKRATTHGPPSCVSCWINHVVLSLEHSF